MAASKTIYACAECGAQSPRWLGRCPECGNWNTMMEETVEPARSTGPASSAKPMPITGITVAAETRAVTGIDELDRLLGGGLAPGMTVLVGGDPGIGKSTLMLQAAHRMAQAGRKCLYVTGEESPRQMRIRAERLGAMHENILTLAETDVARVIVAAAESSAAMVVVDSIQTMRREGFRDSGHRHAGARVRLGARGGGEGDRDAALSRRPRHQVRRDCRAEGLGAHGRLRAVLRGRPLAGVPDTSRHEEPLRADERNRRVRDDDEGPQRGCQPIGGVPAGRRERALQRHGGRGRGRGNARASRGNPGAHGACAVRHAGEARYGRGLQPRGNAPGRAGQARGASARQHGRFVNAAGGVRVDEPAADLGIAAAVASSLRDVPLPKDAVFIGEVGLGGELRAVPSVEARLREAEKLGFKTAFIPNAGKGKIHGKSGIRTVAFRTLTEVLEAALKK